MKPYRLTYPIVTDLSPAVLVVLLFGCSGHPISPANLSEEESLEQQSTSELALDPLAPGKHTLHSLFSQAKRTILTGGVAHYEFAVRMGPEEFDVVRFHRVVRERRRSRPVRTRGAVFMVPGSGQTFDAIFLRPGVDKPDARTSAPVYLAAGGVDVWGFDLSWTQVPAEIGDVSFMRDCVSSATWIIRWPPCRSLD